MAGTACIKRVMELSKDALSQKEAEKLLDDLERVAKRSRAKDMDFDDAVLKRATEIALNTKQNALIQKRNAYINLQKRIQTMNTLNSFMDQGLSLRKAFQSLLVGTERNIENGRFSIAARQLQLTEKYIGGMVADLERGDLLPAFNNKEIHRLIAKELWELDRDGGKPGVSKLPEAQKIAGIIHKYQSIARDRMNRAGASIGKQEGYITRQSHDMYRIRKSGYEKWKEEILPRLDVERTFGDADPDDFLKSAYERLTTGIHLKNPLEDGDKLFSFKGPGNLAKKASQERVFHFRDADSWMDYNNLYGTKDLMESVMRGLEYNARNTGMMEVLGTNPRAMYDRLADDLSRNNRSDQKRMDGWSKPALDKFFNQLDGTVFIPENPTGALIGSIVRAVQSMAKLGGAVVSSVTDVPVLAAELRYNGVGFLESHAQALDAIFTGRGPKERREVASLLGVGFDGISGAITARFSTTDDLPGRMAKLQQLFFKLNGLTWWTDTLKSSFAMTLSHRLSQFSPMQFSKLPEDQRQVFTLYGIGDREWDVIRQSQFKDAEGRTYLTPDGIQEINDDVFRNYLSDNPEFTRLKDEPTIQKRIQNARDELETRLQTYYVDRTNHAVITPDPREQAVLNQGLQRGTVMGEVLRTIVQFKQFPVTVINKVIGKYVYGRGKADVPALMLLIAEMTAMGYIAMSAKDILKGREPRKPNDAATWAAAMAQGGGAGIFGDFMFGQYNRFGQSFTQTLAGPTFGTIDDLARIYGKLKEGDNPSTDVFNTALANTPFANLFYTRTAMDYLFIYQLQETMNPGYLRRMEKRMQDQNNQDFLIRPTEAIQ